MSDELCPFPLSNWNNRQLAELYSIVLMADARERAIGLEVTTELERRVRVERAAVRAHEQLA